MIVAVCVVLALVAAGVAAQLVSTRSRASHDRDAVLAAARQYAVDLTTYDFSTVDADFARFSRHGTKAFQASYAETIATAKPAVLKAQSRALGTVVGAGLEAFHAGKARVLLVVDQEVRSAQQTGATVDKVRIRMSLVKAGDGWLVTAVDVV